MWKTVVLLVLCCIIQSYSQKTLFFDFEDMDIEKAHNTNCFIIKNNQAAFTDAQPSKYCTVVNGGPYTYSLIEYKNYDVGKNWLHSSPTWCKDNDKRIYYHHIEMILKKPLLSNKYYKISFLIGNMKSHQYKPSHYGIKFSKNKIIKQNKGGLLSQPDIFFSFDKDNELILWLCKLND